MKNILKIILLTAFVLIIIAGAFIGINYYINKKINLIDVYVASHNIEGRHLIVEDDIKVIKIPAKYILENAVNNKEEILNKYTDIQGKIPTGSPFFKSMILSIDELPDSPILNLKEKQVAYTTLADVLSLSGNSLVSGQRINLYGSINISQDKIVEDLLIHNVRIISIKDSKGYELSHPNSTKIPFTITFAIEEASLPYISIIDKIGKLEIYAHSNSYSKTDEARLNLDSKLIKYIDEVYNSQ